MQNKTDLMKSLILRLNQASKAYYQESREIISNYEYDTLYDELVQLEAETGITLSDSPTIHVGYEVLSELPKERHASRMLSLDKTKDVQVLKSWLGTQKAILSWKLDGLTIVLTYRGGELLKAVTRGNGEIGEVITNNARVFKNLPHKIPYQGELILRGEAVISYTDFARINETLCDADAKYKNPRNLCSGSVRQLNNEITAQRNVRFYAFALVQAQDVDFGNSRIRQFSWLASQGFEVVSHVLVDASNLEAEVFAFSERISQNDIPSDGLVLTCDDIAYSRSLGTTAKFPRDSMAFKWEDETALTHLEYIEWSASRTGLINPVAVFEPVELEGTTVTRASVHNISMMEELQLGIGDTLSVYKANMIIPQIAENLTRSGRIDIPKVCPVCGQPTTITKTNDTKLLCCPNEACPAKKIMSYTLFVSREAFNIEGLSEATLEKFVQHGFIHEYADIFKLTVWKEQIIGLEGFGEKSYNNLIESIDQHREVTLDRFLCSLGIAGVGTVNAKLICDAMGQDLNRIRHADVDELTQIPGIGPVIAESVTAYFREEANALQVDHLLAEVTIRTEAVNTEAFAAGIQGKTFVITGSLNHFPNRGALKKRIEEKGGKVASAVSSKTDYLINNDSLSSSSKNKKARELSVPVITEEDFLLMADIPI